MILKLEREMQKKITKVIAKATKDKINISEILDDLYAEIEFVEACVAKKDTEIIKQYGPKIYEDIRTMKILADRLKNIRDAIVSNVASSETKKGQQTTNQIAMVEVPTIKIQDKEKAAKWLNENGLGYTVNVSYYFNFPKIMHSLTYRFMNNEVLPPSDVLTIEKVKVISNKQEG